MKVQSTISYPNGSQQVILSPEVATHLDLAGLARLLDGEDPSTLLSPKSASLPPDFASKSRREFIAIPINDAPLGEKRYISRVLVTEWPLVAQVFAGAILERKGGRWFAYTGIGDNKTVESIPAILIREAWPILLARVVAAELAPYLMLSTDLTRIQDAKICREIQSRCNFYNSVELGGFFRSRLRLDLWRIGALWNEWEVKGLSVQERLNELAAMDPPGQVDESLYQRICNDHGLKPPSQTESHQTSELPATEVATRRTPRRRAELFTLLRSLDSGTERRLSEFGSDEELDTIYVSGRDPEPEGQPTLAERELALIKDWSAEEDAVFSYGGDPEINYDLDPEIWTAPPPNLKPTLAELMNHVWWWKAFGDSFKADLLSLISEKTEKATVKTQFSQWTGELQKLFFDNWERSAFMYEFHARYEGRYSWFFRKPWVKLNFTERGILACIWPPKHTGPSRIQPRLSPVVLAQMKKKISIRLQHNIQSPSRALSQRIIEQVTEMAAREGYKVPGKGEGSRKKLPWRALAVMDLKYLMGRTLPDNKTKLKKFTQEFEKSCQEVGLIP